MERIVGVVLTVVIVGLGGIIAKKTYEFWGCGAPCYGAYAGIKLLKPPMP